MGMEEQIKVIRKAVAAVIEHVDDINGVDDLATTVRDALSPEEIVALRKSTLADLLFSVTVDDLCRLAEIPLSRDQALLGLARATAGGADAAGPAQG